MRRPLSQVSLVEPRCLTYQRPWARWKRACGVGGKLVAGGQCALAARGEVGVEGVALVPA